MSNILRFTKARMTSCKIDSLVAGRPTWLRLISDATTATVKAWHEDGTPCVDTAAPPNGRVQITPRSKSPLNIEVTLQPGNVLHQMVFDPLVREPDLNFRVRPFSMLGAALPMRYRSSSARRVVITADGHEHIGGGAGVAIFRPMKAGLLLVEITTFDEFGSGSASRTVRVFSRKPTIQLNETEISGRPGNTATFLWHVRNAEQVWFDGEPEKLIGGRNVTIGRQQQQLTLLAKGAGGERSKILMVSPYLLGDIQ
jgi:hypothetical protein